MAGTINFLDKVPQIAKSAGLLTQQQLYDVDFAQAVFDQAHEQGAPLVPAGQKPGDVLRQYGSPQALNQAIEQYGLDRRAINDKAQMFAQGYQSQNAPYFMDTLEVFGHITKGQKEPLLAAQFGARTAQTMRQLQEGRSELSLADALQPMRPPRADEAGYLRAAQNVEQTAKILAAAIVENPELKADPEIQAAVTSLELLSAQSFKQSASAARAAGMSVAAEDMEKHRAGQKTNINVISKLASTSTLVAKVEAGMEKAAQHAGQKDPAKGQAIRQAMASRREEMKQLKVFGSLLAPDALFTKKELSFAERVSQSRGNGQGGSRGF